MRTTYPYQHNLSTCISISAPLPPTGTAATHPAGLAPPSSWAVLPLGPAAAVDDVWGVEAEVDIGRVGGVEDAAYPLAQMCLSRQTGLTQPTI